MSRKAVLPLSARRKSRETSMLLVSSMGRDRIVSNDTWARWLTPFLAHFDPRLLQYLCGLLRACSA
jgi:hypothetical protein